MIIRRTICIFLFVCLSLAVGAGAQRQQQRQDPCANANTQFDMNQCAHRQYEAADSELNKSYNLLAGRLEADRKALLKEAELAWIKYRDANCEYESSIYAGGTMRPMVESYCLERMTKARTVELREQIKDLEK